MFSSFGSFLSNIGTCSLCLNCNICNVAANQMVNCFANNDCGSSSSSEWQSIAANSTAVSISPDDIGCWNNPSNGSGAPCTGQGLERLGLGHQRDRAVEQRGQQLLLLELAALSSRANAIGSKAAANRGSSRSRIRSWRACSGRRARRARKPWPPPPTRGSDHRVAARESARPRRAGTSPPRGGRRAATARAGARDRRGHRREARGLLRRGEPRQRARAHGQRHRRVPALRGRRRDGLRGAGEAPSRTGRPGRRPARHQRVRADQRGRHGAGARVQGEGLPAREGHGDRGAPRGQHLERLRLPRPGRLLAPGGAGTSEARARTSPSLPSRTPGRSGTERPGPRPGP